MFEKLRRNPEIGSFFLAIVILIIALITNPFPPVWYKVKYNNGKDYIEVNIGEEIDYLQIKLVGTTFFWIKLKEIPITEDMVADIRLNLETEILHEGIIIYEDYTYEFFYKLKGS